jgi:alginate O-acetyltransferase complex protein AlgJ
MSSPFSHHPRSTMGAARQRHWAAGSAAALFFAWLLFPLTYGFFHPAPGGHPPAGHEDIRLPEPGGRPLSDFLRDFSQYFEKASPIRPLILPKFLAFRLYALRLPTLSSVVVGRDHWLFMGQETSRIDEFRYFLGSNLFQEETLAQWLKMLDQRRRWLEQRGIAYWLVVAPNKSTIYPEYMPAICPRGRKTRMDQLVEGLARRAPGFPLIDLRPVLRAGKKERLIYWPSDTHWNDLGRDLAYREIVRRLAARFPSLKAIPEDAFATEPCGKTYHDLEDILLLPWEVQGPFFHLVPKRPLPAHPVLKRDMAAADRSLTFCSDEGAIPLALIIHDSFGDTLKPLLGSHFRKSIWLLDRDHVFPAEWIDRRRPSLVIDEFVERYLEEDPWSNPPEIRDQR